MYWKQPITTECLEMDTVTRLVFFEILIHARNEDMKYPMEIIHGNKRMSICLKRGESIFKSSELKKIGISRASIERSIRILSGELHSINGVNGNQDEKNDIQSAFKMTFIRKPFGFIVSIQNYDELIKMTFNNLENTHSSDIQSAFNQHTNNKSVKNVENEKSKKIKEEADEILSFFNKTHNKKLRTKVSWIENYEFWRKTYSLEEIKEAIETLNHDEWWAKDNPSLELLFRTRNKSGKCDYISHLLDLQTNSNPF